MKGNTLLNQNSSSKTYRCTPISFTVSLLLTRNGMLRESQLSTRNMVNAVTQEFWKMVNDSIHEQALQFKSECNFVCLCILWSLCVCACIVFAYLCSCVWLIWKRPCLRFFLTKQAQMKTQPTRTKTTPTKHTYQ